MRLSGATRELAGYLEKSRSNAIRRNGTANVSIVDANNYSVTMDFDGDGNTETRTISLSDGVSFATDSIGISTTFDWRGRIISQIGIGLQNTHGATNSINLSGSGDISLGDEFYPDNAIGGSISIQTSAILSPRQRQLLCHKLRHSDNYLALRRYHHL